MLRSEPHVLVNAKSISKSYGDKDVLQPLSFRVQEGEVLGLLGANGGGKTTILRIAAGLVAQTSGNLNVLGYDLPKHASKANQEVAYMAQGFSMYGELTVQENLKFRADIYGVDKPEVVIDALLHRFDLKAHVNTRAMHLSGGWARMLQLAAAVLHKPKLLLLDEPTSGLDARARQLVWRHIDELAKSGMGIIISTHDLNEAAQCNEVLLLSGGRLLASGTPKEVIEVSNVCTYMFNNKELNTFINELNKGNIPYITSREHDNSCIVFMRNNQSKLMFIAKALDVEFTEIESTLIDASAILIQDNKSKKELEYD